MSAPNALFSPAMHRRLFAVDPYGGHVIHGAEIQEDSLSPPRARHFDRPAIPDDVVERVFADAAQLRLKSIRNGDPLVQRLVAAENQRSARPRFWSSNSNSQTPLSERQSARMKSGRGCSARGVTGCAAITAAARTRTSATALNRPVKRTIGSRFSVLSSLFPVRSSGFSVRGLGLVVSRREQSTPKKNREPRTEHREPGTGNRELGTVSRVRQAGWNPGGSSGRWSTRLAAFGIASRITCSNSSR